MRTVIWMLMNVIFENTNGARRGEDIFKCMDIYLYIYLVVVNKWFDI